MIEVDLVQAIHDFVRDLPTSMPLASSAEASRLKLVDASSAWLKGAARV